MKLGLAQICQYFSGTCYTRRSPPHFAVVDKKLLMIQNPRHRDGIHFLYEEDPDSNFIEKIDRPPKILKHNYCKLSLVSFNYF